MQKRDDIQRSVGRPPKSRAEDINTRAAILEAARQVFAQRGVDGTSVREVAQTAKVNLLIWCAIVALLIFMAAAKFSAFAGDPETLKMLDSMPPALLDALSMRAFNLTTLSGFYGVMFIYFALMAAIAAAMWGSDIISKEERDKTVEFSLVLPVSRTMLITAKALAALINCIVFVLVTWLFSLVAARSFDPEPGFASFLALEMQAMFAIELIFLAVGLFLGCAMKQYKRSARGARQAADNRWLAAILRVTDFQLQRACQTPDEVVNTAHGAIGGPETGQDTPFDDLERRIRDILEQVAEPQALKDAWDGMSGANKPFSAPASRFAPAFARYVLRDPHQAVRDKRHERAQQNAAHD